VNLSPFYPHPTHWPAWLVALAAAVVLGASAAAVVMARRRPYVFVGWFWFLGMLVPVLGLIQAGLQAMADRYTYLPSIGLLMAIVWGAAELPVRFPRVRPLLAAVGAVLLLVLGVFTWAQQGYWRSTKDLFEHALAVDPENWMGHVMVGRVVSARGDHAAAAEHYTRALKGNPNSTNALIGRAHSSMQLGNSAQAVEDLKRAVALEGNFGLTHFNLGLAYTARGSWEEAAASFAESARLVPENAHTHVLWGESLLRLGRREGAAARFREALRLSPNHPHARDGLRRATAPSTAPATVPAG
jgi:tetratricopeptide (TPR) repeat protein